MKPIVSDLNDQKGWKFIFRALSHRNYRLFFGGQSISLIGTWMQQIAVSWLAYRLTNSAVWLGVVGFSTRIPALVFAPFAGVLADRWNRHRTLVVTQTLSMIQALILAALVLTGWVTIWEVIVLSLFLGAINALDVPVRQSFIVDMVESGEDLSNAIALNSSMVNSARLLGPSIAGIMIAYMGEGMCFFLNGLSYLAVIFSLLSMKMASKKRETRATHILQGMKEGFSYAFGFSPIRSYLLLLTLISLTGMSHTVLMPVFARDVLHGDSHTLGFLMGASGVGALVGSFYMASRRSVLGLEGWSPIAAGIFSVNGDVA